MKNKWPVRGTLLSLALVIAFGTTGWADFTTINNKWAANGAGTELNLLKKDANSVGILDLLYGESNLQRYDDFGTGTLDQEWWEYNGIATAQAKYAGNAGTLKFKDSSGTTTVLSTPGNTFGFFAGNAAGTVVSPTGNFEWLLTSGGYTFSSIMAKNGGGMDHMVTFLVTADTTKWIDHNNDGIQTANETYTSKKGDVVIAWEDLPYNSSSLDRDYQDLVFQLHGMSPVPSPSAMVSVIGLAIMGLCMVRRRRKT